MTGRPRAHDARRARRRAGPIASLLVVAVLGVSGLAVAANVNVTSERLTTFVHDVAATPTPTQTFTCDLFPSGDTFADQQNATATNGAATTLSVQSRTPTGGGTERNRRIFMRFGLSGSGDPQCQALGASSQVESATLALYVEGSPASGRTYQVQRVASSWAESTLSWSSTANTGAGPVIASASSDTPLFAGHMTWDVTSDLANLLQAPALNYGWRIRDADEGSVGGPGAATTFRSKEGASPLFPRLRVVYSQ